MTIKVSALKFLIPKIFSKLLDDVILNFTSIAVDSFSLYSTSASANADWILTHQFTGLNPFFRWPLL